MARLHRACFAVPRPWSEAEIAALLASGPVFCEAAAQGFVLGRVVLDEAELLTLAVAPAARRQGTGRALLAAFEATARGRGAARAYLEVAADNAAAQALYRGAGWIEAGRRRGYFTAPGQAAIDALVFSKAM